MEVAGNAVVLESSFSRVEHHRVLQVFVARLIVCLGSVLARLISVLAWARNIKLQTLSIVSLIEVETWGGAIESDLLANLRLKVTCSSLFNPLGIAR